MYIMYTTYVFFMCFVFIFGTLLLFVTDSTTKYSWVLASENRVKIMMTLFGKQLKPTTISDKTDIHTSNVSNYIRDLSEKELIECISPEQKKGRIYQLTDEGKSIVNRIKENRE